MVWEGKRISSGWLYIYSDLRRGTRWAATNLRTLERKSGIPYGRLRYWFYDKNKDQVEFDLFRIERLDVDMIFTKNDR